MLVDSLLLAWVLSFHSDLFLCLPSIFLLTQSAISSTVWRKLIKLHIVYIIGILFYHASLRIGIIYILNKYMGGGGGLHENDLIFTVYLELQGLIIKFSNSKTVVWSFHILNWTVEVYHWSRSSLIALSIIICCSLSWYMHQPWSPGHTS